MSVNKMKQLISIILVLVFNNIIYAKDNNLLIVLQQRESLGQTYYQGEEFPKDWIDERWKKSYRIKYVNHKDNKWFIVMEKEKYPKKQKYIFNASNNKLSEMAKDGYSIQDLCLVVNNMRIDHFYVFTKISNNPVHEIAYSGLDEDMDTWFEEELQRRIQVGFKNNFFSDIARSYCIPNNVGDCTKNYYVLIMRKDKGNQLSEYRKSPNDYIYNQQSKGYYLSSLTYDWQKKSYLIVMKKSSLKWKLFNITNPKDKKEFEKFYNKNYFISGIF
jgi:hypothetical protein